MPKKITLQFGTTFVLNDERHHTLVNPQMVSSWLVDKATQAYAKGDRNTGDALAAASREIVRLVRAEADELLAFHHLGGV